VPPDVRKAVNLGSLLHDVGKIGIADSILLKPGPLTEEEWEIMRTHPTIGERMLKDVDFLAPALQVVRWHHERWDGKGYPDGLREDQIPLAARIVSVCDAFDAMTSDRPYRPALPTEAAINELIGAAGTQLDPRCALLLVEVVRSMGIDDLEERFVRYAT
jgi:HD-GYP domain-containing protein (c-di-GMP phosphodiesterase class II)